MKLTPLGPLGRVGLFPGTQDENFKKKMILAYNKITEVTMFEVLAVEVMESSIFCSPLKSNR
jgi:hypothetical protein